MRSWNFSKHGSCASQKCTHQERFRVLVIPCAGDLTLVKALNLLNHVLKIMFDMEYKRQAGSRQQLKGGDIFTYALRESIDFIRFKPGVKQETIFPILPAWATEESPGLWTGDLSEQEVLAVCKGLVQPAASFTSRQTSEYRLKESPGIEIHHVGLSEPPIKSVDYISNPKTMTI